jgi:hypothetical protein
MNTKLTLSLNQQIVEAAKEIAKKRNTSLSKIVEEYFYKLMNSNKSVEEIDPDITSMIGKFKMKDDREYKTIINEEREKKHLKS